MNNLKNNKITLSQGLLLFTVVVYPMIIRFVISNVTQTAKQAGWLSFISSMIILVPFIYMLYKVSKNFEGKSFHDILCIVFGKPAGFAITIVYLIWLLLTLSMSIKLAGEKLVSTAFVGTDINLVMFLMVASVAVMLRWGIAVLARMNRAIFILLIVQFIIVMLFVSLNFKIEYVTPVSTLDILPIFHSAIFPLAVNAYITPLFVFNDQIMYDKKNFGKFALTSGFLLVAGTSLLFIVIGTFSHYLVAKQKFPFLSAVENISVFDSSAGLDSLFASIWILSEFVMIAFFTYCVIRLIKGIFKLKAETPVSTAVLAFSFFFAVYFCTDVFEFLKFIDMAVPVVNIALGVVVPVILFTTAKIRKMI